MPLSLTPSYLKNYVKNTKKKLNIHLFKMGISNEVGTKTFHENVLHSTSTLENINIDSKYLHRKSAILGVKPENITKESYSINVTKLSTFIKDNCANENIDLLKIDTEGHEYSCLLGLFDNEKNVNIKYLQLESHNDDMYHNTKSFSEISDLLKENNFELAEKIKHGFGNIYEVLFVHKG